jgi:hypothetical protein
MPIPRPPRQSGDAKEDSTAMVNWAFEVFKSFELNDEFLRRSEAFDDSGFDPNSLPDPATSTIAIAQSTANEAFVLAAYAFGQANENKARLDSWIFGTVTVAAAATTGVATFAAAQADAVYNLVLSPVSITGTPDVGAFRVTAIAQTAAGFTVTVAVAPGLGNSVTFNYQLRR